MRPELFWAKVVRGEGCWDWKGSHSKAGYGHYTWKEGGRTRTRGAHVLAYELTHGVTLLKKMTIDHVVCQNVGCCNPDHLEVVTQRVNTLRSETNFIAVNARKTHCPQGHEYSGDNLHLKPGKHGFLRVCRQCGRDYAARKRKERAST